MEQKWVLKAQPPDNLFGHSFRRLMQEFRKLTPSCAGHAAELKFLLHPVLTLDLVKVPHARLAWSWASKYVSNFFSPHVSSQHVSYNSNSNSNSNLSRISSSEACGNFGPKTLCYVNNINIKALAKGAPPGAACLHSSYRVLSEF
eukprot:1149469-Pelagomonas_calceolata.AAC.4